MAIYLGSDRVKFTSVATGYPVLEGLIDRTISIYSNSTISEIGSYAFADCISLTTVNLYNVTSIKTYAFGSCYNLLSVYLLGNSIPSLASTAFYSTPISTYTTSTGGIYGSIFVPASLYSDYLVANGWSYYSSCIVSR